MLVDLFTQDRELASVILESFPGKIIPDSQYKVDDSEPEAKVYCFYSLKYPVIREFLETHEGEYELRRQDGRVIKTRQEKTSRILQGILFKAN